MGPTHDILTAQEKMGTPAETSESRNVGGEVLVLEKDASLAGTLAELLTSTGLVVTATSDVARAERLVHEKFFPVAILDMDTPGDWQGLDVIKRIHKSSPATAVIFLTHRETFERAVRAFRAGARDVISKRSQNVEYIADRTHQLIDRSGRGDLRKDLLRDTERFLERFLERLMDASRNVWKADGRSKDTSGFELAECVVLVVDDNEATAKGLQHGLSKIGGFRCVGLPTGGEALDYAGQNVFHMALVKEELPDLAGGIVAKSLGAQGDNCLVMLFNDPATGTGKLSLVEKSRVMVLLPELTSGAQLIEQIQRLRDDAYGAKMKERKFLEAFQSENYQFLKRYVDLRKRIAELAESDSK